MRYIVLFQLLLLCACNAPKSNIDKELYDTTFRYEGRIVKSYNKRNQIVLAKKYVPVSKGIYLDTNKSITIYFYDERNNLIKEFDSSINNYFQTTRLYEYDVNDYLISEYETNELNDTIRKSTINYKDSGAYQIKETLTFLHQRAGRIDQNHYRYDTLSIELKDVIMNSLVLRSERIDKNSKGVIQSHNTYLKFYNDDGNLMRQVTLNSKCDSILNIRSIYKNGLISERQFFRKNIITETVLYNDNGLETYHIGTSPTIPGTLDTMYFKYDDRGNMIEHIFPFY